MQVQGASPSPKRQKIVDLKTVLDGLKEKEAISDDFVAPSRRFFYVENMKKGKKKPKRSRKWQKNKVRKSPEKSGKVRKSPEKSGKVWRDFLAPKPEEWESLCGASHHEPRCAQSPCSCWRGPCQWTARQGNAGECRQLGGTNDRCKSANLGLYV